MSFENFVQKIDRHMQRNSCTSLKTGKQKAAYELRCTWFEPFGSRFTYRSDILLKNLAENMGILATDELHACQIKFAFIRERACKAIIYDNTEGWPGKTLFQWEHGKVTVDHIDWNKYTESKPKAENFTEPENTNEPATKRNTQAAINALSGKYRVNKL